MVDANLRREDCTACNIKGRLSEIFIGVALRYTQDLPDYVCFRLRALKPEALTALAIVADDRPRSEWAPDSFCY